MSKLIKNNKIEILVWLIILFYIIFFSYLSIRKYLTLQSNYYDLGIMHQVVYNTAQGRFLEMTNQDFGKNISRLAVHFDPILAFFAPLYKIYNSPEVLLIIQTIILGLGAWAVFLIAKNILKDKKLGLVFALCYLFYFPVERANLFDFHPVTLATTFLLFMIYFSLVKKYRLMFFFAFLSLLTKENVGLILIFFGGYQLFFKKDKKYLSLILIGVIFFVSTVNLIIPFFRQETHFAVRYFGDFGDSPKNIFIGIVKDPVLIINYFIKYDSLMYLGRLLLPIGIFIIFSPLAFLISLPELMINILSTNSNMRAIYFHYNSLIVPFIIFSLILGYKKLKETIWMKKFRNFFWFVFITTNIVSIYFFNPLPFSFLKEPYWWGRIDTKKLEIIQSWQKKLGDKEKVATTPRIAPFFSGRRYYYNFLYDTGYAGIGISDNDIIKGIDNYTLADYIIIDRSEIFDNQEGKLPKQFYQHLLSNKNYQTIYRGGEIEIYKKVI